MSDDDQQDQLQETRYLNQTPSARYLEQRGTSPLDQRLPWVLEFRVVGTASTLQKRLTETMVLGRGDPDHNVFPEIDLTPFHAYTHGVSRRHAIINVREGRITVKDLDSTNGTKLNEFDLLPGTEYRLRHGDELTLGQLKLQVLFAVVPARQDEEADTASTAQASPLVDGAGQRVLIVEDDDDVASIFRTALEQAHFKVEVVKTAVTAIGQLSDQAPDAIVFDLVVPDLSGLDFVRYVRKNFIGQRVPLVVVSGATAGFQMSKALEAGADVVLGKPVVVDDLVAKVAEAIQQAKNSG